MLLQALLRDNHRCVFTGKVDMGCSRIAANIVPSTRLTQTNVAHIISQSLRENIDGITPAHQAKVCMDGNVRRPFAHLLIGSLSGLGRQEQ